MNVFTTPDYEVQKIRVVDGDTLSIEVKKVVTVRLSRINCPERKDKGPWQVAKDFVQKKVEEAKSVKIVSVKNGNFGRYLAEVFVDGKNLNNELMENGMAKLYKRGK